MIYFFSHQEGLNISGLVKVFVFSVLLLSFPFSFSMFYKFVVGFCIYSCPTPVILTWVLYSLSEQIFFVKFLCSFYIPQDRFGVLGFV